MAFVARSIRKGAASCAALFAFVIVVALPIGILSTHVAAAKPAAGKLAIEPHGGGPALAFDIEIATTDEERAVGLMFRTSLADDHGMLFHYGASQELTMWMRNTYIPLDMVFIRPDGVIHRIEVMAEPLSDRVISSGQPVAAVLELAGGAAARLGIKPGDVVRHPLFGGLPSAPQTAAPAMKDKAQDGSPPGY